MYSYYRIFCRKEWRLIKIDPRTLSTPEDAEMYINICMQLYKNKGIATYFNKFTSVINYIDAAEDRLKLEGFLRYHIQFCGRFQTGCPCGDLAVKISKLLE